MIANTIKTNDFWQLASENGQHFICQTFLCDWIGSLVFFSLVILGDFIFKIKYINKLLCKNDWIFFLVKSISSIIELQWERIDEIYDENGWLECHVMKWFVVVFPLIKMRHHYLQYINNRSSFFVGLLKLWQLSV